MYIYPRKLRFTCTKCALCCADTPEKTRHILLLSNEAQEISSFRNQSASSFAIPVNGRQPYILEMKKNSEGQCVFLKNNQCTIYEQRPLICRFYPFELKTQNAQQIFNFTEECPAIKQGKSIKKEHFECLFKLAQERLRQT